MPVLIGGGDGLVYTPAETGFNLTNVAAAGTIVNGIIIPLSETFGYRSISVIRELDVGSGTPMTVLFHSIGPRNVQWSDGLVGSGLWAGITNNPRTQWAHYTRGQSTATLSTGTAAAGEFAKIFSSPWGRFAVQNNDAAVAVVVSLTVILWKV